MCRTFRVDGSGEVHHYYAFCMVVLIVREWLCYRAAVSSIEFPQTVVGIYDSMHPRIDLFVSIVIQVLGKNLHGFFIIIGNRRVAIRESLRSTIYRIEKHNWKKSIS